MVIDLGAGGLVLDEAGELRGLEGPAHGVVVEGIALGGAELAGFEPGEVLGEPGFDSGAVFRREQGAHEERGGAGDFYEVEGIDDAEGAAGGDTFDALRKLQVGVHAGGGGDEPGAEVGAGGFAVTLALLVPKEDPGGGEGGHLDGEADHGFAVIGEVFGIALAVAVDVGAVRVFGVGPEVVGLGVEVVEAAGAALGGEVCDGGWFLGEI